MESPESFVMHDDHLIPPLSFDNSHVPTGKTKEGRSPAFNEADRAALKIHYPDENTEIVRCIM